jgi:hypothetical protein
MGVARGSDAAIGIPNHGLDAAAVGLQVNEVGFNGPTCIGWLVAEEQEALVDFNIVLAFDVGGFEFVHGLGGLVGDDCKKESAEKCEAEAGGQHDVARRKGGFEFGFGFVGHGLGCLIVEHIFNHNAILENPMAADVSVDFFVHMDLVFLLEPLGHCKSRTLGV